MLESFQIPAAVTAVPTTKTLSQVTTRESLGKWATGLYQGLSLPHPLRLPGMNKLGSDLHLTCRFNHLFQDHDVLLQTLQEAECQYIGLEMQEDLWASSCKGITGVSQWRPGGL